MKSYRAIKTATLIALIISAVSMGYLVYLKGKNKRIIYSHRNEYHQIIHHLFDKKIIENQVVETIIKKHPPTKVSSHDNYLTLQYFKNNEEVDDCCIYYTYYIHIIVRNNHLVKAFATEGFVSTIDYVFFDVLSESSENDYWDSRVKSAVTMNNM